MKRFLAISATTLIAGAGLAVTAPPATADERTCRGSLGAVTVDNLRVPSGATCELTGTTVKGTITVATDARLVARSVRVIGNVQAEGHRSVTVVSASVGGSIQLVQGGTATLRGNAVKGDVQLFTNTGAQAVNRNRIDGNLQCKENSPKPTGTGNIVGGNKEDQCRGL